MSSLYNFPFNVTKQGQLPSKMFISWFIPEMMFKRKTLFHFRRNIPPFYRNFTRVFWCHCLQQRVPKKKKLRRNRPLIWAHFVDLPSLESSWVFFTEMMEVSFEIMEKLEEIIHLQSSSVCFLNVWEHRQLWNNKIISVETSNSGCYGSKIWLDKIKWVILIFQIYSKRWIPYFWVHEPCHWSRTYRSITTLP